MFRLYQTGDGKQDFLDEHPVIIPSFHRPGYKPQTDGGKILKACRAAGFSEQDCELVRIEAAD
jgi:hypothetical protein